MVHPNTLAYGSGHLHILVSEVMHITQFCVWSPCSFLILHEKAAKLLLCDAGSCSWLCFDKDPRLSNMILFWFTFQKVCIKTKSVKNCSLTTRLSLAAFHGTLYRRIVFVVFITDWTQLVEPSPCQTDKRSLPYPSPLPLRSLSSCRVCCTYPQHSLMTNILRRIVRQSIRNL